MKKNKVLLLSCSVIMLCICIVAGMSYALFTHSISVGNHLQAGNLKAELWRTNLTYKILNDDGELAQTELTGRVDLSNTSTEDTNIFGLDASGIYIVPGSCFEAKMELKNAGNTAFDYDIYIVYEGATLDEDAALAQQLQVTFTDAAGTSTSCQLSDLLSGGDPLQRAKLAKGRSTTFTVKIEFVNNDTINNAAQDGSVKFDLIVRATQAVATTTTH